VACKEKSALETRANEARLEVWAGKLSGAAGMLGAVAFGKYLAREGFELVVANVGRDVRLGAVACALAGAKLLQRRGIARPIKKDALHRRLYTKSVRRVVANCEAIRSAMLEGADFVDPARFVVIPNAVHVPADEEPSPIREQLALEHAPLAGAVGRLSPMKGLEHLVDAWPAVREAVPDARLVLVGEGELADELHARAAERGVADDVHLAGFRADAPAVIAALDVLAMPSVRDEGASNTLLEAMARGRAAVVSDVGGLPETVGEAGVVVPSGDVPALAEAVAGLLGDPERREALGHAALARVRERHAPDVVTARWEELLSEVRDEDGRV
jgi:glycosyltransferase involved in cell wall biosynthesis